MSDSSGSTFKCEDYQSPPPLNPIVKTPTSEEVIENQESPPVDRLGLLEVQRLRNTFPHLLFPTDILTRLQLIVVLEELTRIIPRIE